MEFISLIIITLVGAVWLLTKAYQLDEEISLLQNKSKLLQTLPIKQLKPNAPIPSYKTNGAAGLDLAILDNVVIKSGETVRLPTGLAFEIPENHVGLLFARSSMFYAGLDVSGVIDSDYRGEIQIQAQNNSPNPIKLEAGQRVAQLLIMPVTQFNLELTNSLKTTGRGENGFGSTGK
jgi:dUTP pyrophosphatase